MMNRLAAGRGAPRRIRVDKGPGFVSRALDQWAYLHGVTLDLSRPGKPTNNALIESFNGRLRDECLNINWFLSLDDARRKIEAWREHYNETCLTLGWASFHPAFCRTGRKERRPMNPDYSLRVRTKIRGPSIGWIVVRLSRSRSLSPKPACSIRF
jgi:hypothetical protein